MLTLQTAEVCPAKVNEAAHSKIMFLLQRYKKSHQIQLDPVGTNPTQGSPASQLSREFLGFVKFCKSLLHCSLARAFGWAGRQGRQEEEEEKGDGGN